ncbi:MAG: hypothetical protein HY898_10340 [Deltaproteobacteria bacterium]|nr:hypothetical protein [Deltaproteobacteria bacterium]
MFWNALVNIERASCSFRLMGPCEQKVKCGPPQAYLTAGTVRINGGKAPLVFSDDGVGLYDVQQGAGALLFDGGETLTVTADGSPVAGADDIPKFNEALQAPPLAVVNSPSFEDFPPIDAPISLAWSPFQGGKVYLEIVPKGDIATVIQCRVPSEAGTFTLPPEVMEQFSPGPGNCVSVASAGDKRFQAGKFGVEFLALYVATRPDGKNASVCSK